MNAVYSAARDRYAQLGVDTENALERLSSIPISMQCWQGDDVRGFENPEIGLSGGLVTTGSYMGRARTPEELRSDIEMALKLIPGRKRLNLHAIYGQFEPGVSRNSIYPLHFQEWIDWAKEHHLGLDFNPTFFSHELADSGFTLSSADEGIRRFWVEHCMACREIGAEMGKQLGTACVVNIWIPDGMKDIPYHRLAPRKRLERSLDEIYSIKYGGESIRDAVESKLFGIGSESYVPGSHEFYMGYAVKNQILLCLDSGHFHPTETISDKLSSVLMFVPEILLHVSRSVHWDSDHVVILTDDLKMIAQELVRGDLLDRTHIGLDYFDASINRVSAWIIGMRAMRQALLLAFLEPSALLSEAESRGDYTSRLMLYEAQKMLPFSSVWDEYCERENVPRSENWMSVVKEYEQTVQFRRKG